MEIKRVRTDIYIPREGNARLLYIFLDVNYTGILARRVLNIRGALARGLTPSPTLSLSLSLSLCIPPSPRPNVSIFQTTLRSFVRVVTYEGRPPILILYELFRRHLLRDPYTR
jgi:hypothetical protein